MGPKFVQTPKIGVAAVSTANTNRDGTGTIATIFNAGTNGSRIDEIVIQATANPADSVVTIFLHDGSNYWLRDEFDLGDPAAASTTDRGYQTSRTYANLNLPSGWSLRAAITVALTSGVLNVFAHGGDYGA